jgi:hypothetical protein
MDRSTRSADWRRAGLALVFAASTLGCAAYEVKEADRDNFALAKVQASQLMSTVEVQKPPVRIDAALAESLRLARAKEETLAVLLAKKSLTTEEVQALQATVAAYRERLTDIAKAAGIEAAAAPVEKSLARIEENLAGYLASHEQEFRQNLQTSLQLIGETLAVVNEARYEERSAAPAARESFDWQLRSSIASLGESLLALDSSLEHELELRAEALVSNPKRVAAVRRELADVDAAILQWLEEVDASLKTSAATGTVPPGFLKADRLAAALESSLGDEAVGDGIESVEQGLTAALGILEELVAGARSFGIEPRDALVVLSEEFSKIVAKFEALHPEASRVTFESGGP